MNGDATKIREEVLSRIEEIKKFLQNLVNGDLGNKEAKALAMAIKRVMEHSNKKIKPGKVLDNLIRNLEDGTKFSSWPGESRTSGTNWENLVIGAIQLLVVDKLDLEGQGILRKGESPDLPDLEIDIKSSTKAGGEGSSTSSKSNTVIGAFKARLTGLDYDIIYIRFRNSKIVRLELLDRVEFADKKCLEVFRGCARVLDGDWDSRDPNPNSLNFKKLLFMNYLFSFLVLKKNPKGDGDIFFLLENAIRTISTEDVTSGLTQKEMQHRIREMKEVFASVIERMRESRGRLGNNSEHQEILALIDERIEQKDALVKSIRIGSGKKVSDNYKHVFNEGLQIEFLLEKISSEEIFGPINAAMISNLGEFPKSGERVEKLLWLTNLISYANTRITALGNNDVLISVIQNSLSEQIRPYSVTTKSFELNLDYSISKEEE